MGREIDLLENYPKSKRDINSRGQEKTESDRKIARQFGKDFFDGDRKHGYGGFEYNSRFWSPVIPTFVKHFSLNRETHLLDVGCAKGFMLHDLSRLVSGINVKGVDISEYAIKNTIEDMVNNVSVADACNLPFADNSFDTVISINTIHNLEEDRLIIALKEIERVASKNAFITVDAYNTEEEKQRMLAWNLTAKTIKSVEQWKELFEMVGYTGDYFWFTP